VRILKYGDLTIEIQHYVRCKNKSDTSNNRANWKHLKIIQKIPGQHTGKVRYPRTAENSHIGHCTHTSESTHLKVQNTQRGEEHYTYHKMQLQNICKTIYPRNMVCFRHVIVNTLQKGDIIITIIIIINNYAMKKNNLSQNVEAYLCTIWRLCSPSSCKKYVQRNK
jgi:hypothetical protein